MMKKKNKKILEVIGWILGTIAILLCLYGIYKVVVDNKASHTQKPGSDFVCCHSWGYGSMMKKCCDEYKWVLTKDCAIDKAFVGGGEEVVSDNNC